MLYSNKRVYRKLLLLKEFLLMTSLQLNILAISMKYTIFSMPFPSLPLPPFHLQLFAVRPPLDNVSISEDDYSSDFSSRTGSFCSSDIPLVGEFNATHRRRNSTGDLTLLRENMHDLPEHHQKREDLSGTLGDSGANLNSNNSREHPIAVFERPSSRSTLSSGSSSSEGDYSAKTSCRADNGTPDQTSGDRLNLLRVSRSCDASPSSVVMNVTYEL